MRLAAEARSDLRDLLQYSLATWGRAQRDAYRTAIRQRFAELADFPRLGRPRDCLFHECRSLSIRHHVADYLVDAAGIFVVRILHERRDPAGAVGASHPR